MRQTKLITFAVSSVLILGFALIVGSPMASAMGLPGGNNSAGSNGDCSCLSEETPICACGTCCTPENSGDCSLAAQECGREFCVEGVTALGGDVRGCGVGMGG